MGYGRLSGFCDIYIEEVVGVRKKRESIKKERGKKAKKARRPAAGALMERPSAKGEKRADGPNDHGE